MRCGRGGEFADPPAFGLVVTLRSGPGRHDVASAPNTGGATYSGYKDSGANYRRFMADGSRDHDAQVAQTAAAVVGRLEAKLAEVTQSIQQTLVDNIAELGDDGQLVELLRDTVAGNVDTFFSAIRHRIPIRQVEPPTAALEYARRLAQRDVSADALVRAYRLGHRGALGVVLDEIRASRLDPRVSLDVFDRMSSVSFEYIDWISQLVVETYQAERERWLQNRNALRGRQVRDLLAGGEVDVDALTTAIRYPLNRVHVGVVVWWDDPGQGTDLDSMERFVRGLAESAGALDAPLFISVDGVTGWGWIPLPAGARGDAVAIIGASAERVADGPNITVGAPLPGVAGFRNSHRQAQLARDVLIASNAGGRRVATAADAGLLMAALLGDQVADAAVWVGEVLGPLATDSENDERLRETLRVFLRAGSSYKAAGDELHLHVNSVRYRVQRAIERRGRPIDADRLDVEVALVLCRHFGAAVLA